MVLFCSPGRQRTKKGVAAEPNSGPGGSIWPPALTKRPLPTKISGELSTLALRGGKVLVKSPSKTLWALATSVVAPLGSAALSSAPGGEITFGRIWTTVDSRGTLSAGEITFGRTGLLEAIVVPNRQVS